MKRESDQIFPRSENRFALLSYVFLLIVWSALCLGLIVTSVLPSGHPELTSTTATLEPRVMMEAAPMSTCPCTPTLRRHSSRVFPRRRCKPAMHRQLDVQLVTQNHGSGTTDQKKGTSRGLSHVRAAWGSSESDTHRLHRSLILTE